ncbi:MAG: ABC transporter ATP-binding protein [Pseudomonadota bacterium]
MNSAAVGATVLSVNGVTRRFGGLVAVDNLSFDIAAHEMVGIIGPNGSGKTTVLNMISGVFKPTVGRISLKGRSISDKPAQYIARQGVGRTFQLVRLLPGLTVIENVIAGAVFGHRRRWARDAEDFAYDILARVGLQGQARGPISSLTYIDQKRLELARVLAGEPQVLLLDEWLAGLNPTELETGIALIHALRDEGRTVLIVEHVMDAIRSLCDRCVVMSSGVKIAEGSTDAVLSDPEVIRAYLGDDDAL